MRYHIVHVGGFSFFSKHFNAVAAVRQRGVVAVSMLLLYVDPETLRL